jgi:hypothetical protein
MISYPASLYTRVSVDNNLLAKTDTTCIRIRLMLSIIKVVCIVFHPRNFILRRKASFIYCER